MGERLLRGEHSDPYEVQRFVSNYPTLQAYMVEQSPLTTNSARKPAIVPHYPTALEVKTLLKDPVVLGAYGVTEYLSTSDLLSRLPIHTAEQQRDGYELFQHIDERMQERRKMLKVSRPHDPLSKLFGLNLDLGDIFADSQQPIITIGGPISGWNFSNVPRNPVWVDYYPDRDVQFILDPRNLPFPDDSLSLIFDSYTPWDMRREVARVLEPDGVFITGGPQALNIYRKTAYGLEPDDYIQGRRKV